MHVFLVAALCLSQLAATVHMAGHFHDEKPTVSFVCDSASNHSQDALCNASEHAAHKFDGSNHTVDTDCVELNVAEIDVEGTIADCAIFHAYVGQVGCLAAASTGITDHFVGSAVGSIATQQVVISALLQYPIRGPPSLLKIKIITA